MRPAAATVISPRPWEGRLVAAAHESGLVRLVARCYDPGDVPDRIAVIAGTETPWLSYRIISGWRRRGLIVIGIYPRGDQPALDLLCRAGADQIFTAATDPMVILRAVRDLMAPDRRSAPVPGITRVDRAPEHLRSRE